MTKKRKSILGSYANSLERENKRLKDENKELISLISFYRDTLDGIDLYEERLSFNVYSGEKANMVYIRMKRKYKELSANQDKFMQSAIESANERAKQLIKEEE